MKPIYKPSGKAGEYGDLAINIYTGCNHGCTYCYAAKMAHRWGKNFTEVAPRKDIAAEVAKQIERENITDKLIHLCFTCDPYPADVDTTATREVIKAIKASGNHVQILTKGGFRAERDFDLLDSGDWFGITHSGYTNREFFEGTDREPNADTPLHRLQSLSSARDLGIKTWVSIEPVFNAEDIYDFITNFTVDKYKIGKLNYEKSDINWREFGENCVSLCEKSNRDYYIKDSLREEMMKGT